ncbi:MAG: hypothetical protein N2Z21_09810 [Candidatus Sumerlaeaceae bacterium]|nr:hypothetical protein [Candidatus Sumerlaeaceae bacterium]
MDKRCEECHLPVAVPGLIVAMEQREHFALTRHTQLCDECAKKLLDFIEKTAAGSRFYFQCVNCIYCGSNLPITRLRFQIKNQKHRHVAICEKCYEMLRDDLLRKFPKIVSFIELEWHTRGMKNSVRTPWPIGSFVRVRRESSSRYAGQTGKIVSFRPLQLPWFGYEVAFVDGNRHFYHERDLEQVSTPDFDTTSRLKDIV